MDAAPLHQRAILKGDHIQFMPSLAYFIYTAEDGTDTYVQKVVPLYKHGIAGGHVMPMCCLATDIVDSMHAVKRDIARAVRIFERVIAEDGDVILMCILAILIKVGTVVCMRTVSELRRFTSTISGLCIT